MGVVLLTVPFTGTQFFSQLLLQHFPSVGLGGAAEEAFCAQHTSQEALDYINRWKLARDVVLATTWRDWTKVERSFIVRGEKLELFRRHFLAWEQLMQEFDPFVLTIEPQYKGKTREQLLEEFAILVGKNSSRSGLHFETDWAPVGAWEEKSAAA